jgi:hypothetical protein
LDANGAFLSFKFHVTSENGSRKCAFVMPFGLTQSSRSLNHVRNTLRIIFDQSTANVFWSDETDVVTFEDKTCQPAGGVGAGVDVDAVRADVRFDNWRMPVDNRFFVSAFVQQKFLTDP